MLLTFLVVGNIEGPLHRVLKTGVEAIPAVLRSHRLAWAAEVSLRDRVRYVTTRTTVSKLATRWALSAPTQGRRK